jgi:hypothetical protein
MVWEEPEDVPLLWDSLFFCQAEGVVYLFLEFRILELGIIYNLQCIMYN